MTYGFVQYSATFVLHHPEHGHTVVLPIISIIIDGTLVYDKDRPPFASFISLFCPNDEVCISYSDELSCMFFFYSAICNAFSRLTIKFLSSIDCKV